MEGHMGEINWIGGVVAGIAGFMLGGLWYSAFFGNFWMSEHKLTKEGPFRYPTIVPMAASIAISIVGALALSWLIGPYRGFGRGLFIGGIVGLLLVAPAIKMNGLFAQDSPKLIAIEAGYPALQYILMGIILGVWP
jgi:hypothetical protein